MSDNNMEINVRIERLANLTIGDAALEGYTIKELIELIVAEKVRIQEQPSDAKENEKKQKDRSLKKRISKILKEMGVPANLLGYEYLKTALELVYKDKDMINLATKVLYPEVARIHNTRSVRVERAMRNAIEIAWERGNIEKHDEYFSYSISSFKGKPTVTEFIATLCEHLHYEE